MLCYNKFYIFQCIVIYITVSNLSRLYRYYLFSLQNMSNQKLLYPLTRVLSLRFSNLFEKLIERWGNSTIKTTKTYAFFRNFQILEQVVSLSYPFTLLSHEWLLKEWSTVGHCVFVHTHSFIVKGRSRGARVVAATTDPSPQFVASSPAPLLSSRFSPLRAEEYEFPDLHNTRRGLLLSCQ